MYSWVRARRALAVTACSAALTTGASAADGAREPLASVAAAARSAIAKGTTPGLAVAVVRGDTIAYEAGFGQADAQGGAVTANTPFAIGSLSKQFTAACVLMLASDGKLGLDDMLAKYLPQLPNATQITLAQLLHQTSGLHNYPRLDEHDWPLTGAIAPARLFAIMATDKSDFPPGAKYEYSNTNYAALAQVVAQSSGIAYGAYLQSHIFDPLGMKDSGYGFAVQSRVAQPSGPDGKWIARADQLSLDLFFGAGGVVSSAHDLALWDAALLDKKILTGSQLQLAWTAGRTSDGAAIDYAMGWIPATLDGHREFWHNGYAPGAGGYTYNAVFPDDGIAVAVLSNSGNPAGETLEEGIVRAVLEAYAPPQAASGEDPVVTTLVRAMLAQLRAGKVDRSPFTPQFSAALTDDLIHQLQPYFTGLGEPQLTLTATRTRGTTTVYVYRGTFADGSVHDVVIALDGGKIAGFHVPP